MAAKTYYLVLFDEAKPKGVSFAMHSLLTEETVKVVLQDDNATITRNTGEKYTITNKRLFDYKNTDGKMSLMIVADAKRVKK